MSLNQPTTVVGNILTDTPILSSPNGNFIFYILSTGILAIKNNGYPVWSSSNQPSYSPVTFTFSPSTGNITLTPVGSASIWSVTITTTGATPSSPPYELVLQDNGVLVIYDSANNNIWYTSQGVNSCNNTCNIINSTNTAGDQIKTTTCITKCTPLIDSVIVNESSGSSSNSFESEVSNVIGSIGSKPNTNWIYVGIVVFIIICIIIMIYKLIKKNKKNRDYEDSSLEDLTRSVSDSISKTIKGL